MGIFEPTVCRLLDDADQVDDTAATLSGFIHGRLIQIIDDSNVDLTGTVIEQPRGTLRAYYCPYGFTPDTDLSGLNPVL